MLCIPLHIKCYAFPYVPVCYVITLRTGMFSIPAVYIMLCIPPIGTCIQCVLLYLRTCIVCVPPISVYMYLMCSYYFLLFLHLRHYIVLAIKGDILPTAPGLLHILYIKAVASLAPKNSKMYGILNLFWIGIQISCRSPLPMKYFTL